MRCARFRDPLVSEDVSIALASWHTETSNILSFRNELETSLNSSDGETACETVNVDETMSHVATEGSTTRHESEVRLASLKTDDRLNRLQRFSVQK